MRRGELVLGRYLLEHRAGAGGMGTVFRATDLSTSEVVALKVLHDPGGEHAERFLREARILAELEHPHVVKHKGQGVSSSGVPFLVMEWLDGEDLGGRLKRGPLSLDESLDLVRRVASVLAYAHTRGIVHRDIKPNNLYLMGGDIARVKVLDFGIARLADPSLKLTRQSRVVGTPGYMAPEQARGEPAVGPAADVFSLGCVLFEVLTGRPAFRGTHPIALLAKLLLEEPPKLAEVRINTPTAVVELCELMLSKDARKRPANGAELLAALEGLDASALSHPPRSMVPSRISREERRHVSIIAMAQPRAAKATANSTARDTVALTGEARKLFGEAQKLAQHLGGSADVLVDGTILLILLDGNPIEQAARAGRAALALNKLAPHTRMAIVTGRSDVADRLPVGDIVERAAALLERAERKDIAAISVDEDSLPPFDALFEVTASGGHFILKRPKRQGGEEARTLLGKPSPFLGRDRELRHLMELVEDGFEERAAQVILVTGSAGMGKSRLRQELLGKLTERTKDLAFAVGRAESLGAGAAFAVIASALRDAMRIQAGEPPLVQQQKVLTAVQRVLDGETASRVAEFLGELVGAPFPDEKSPWLRTARQNAQIMAAQIHSAHIEFVRAISRRSPTLLVLEDLHWGDVSSVKLVEQSLRELKDEPFVVIAFARPEVHKVFPRLWSERNAQELRLGPLPRRAAEELVRRAIGEGLDASLLQAILDRSEGNPFYLEELIRAVTEGRGDVLPETVLGMVESRLAALPADARRLLRAASVFGEVFWKNGTRALFGKERPENFDEMLDDLVVKEIVTRRSSRRFSREDEFSFRHALVHQAAYGMLTERDRSVGHKLAGLWLEGVGEPDPAVLARHFENGGDGARAALWYARAALRAMRGNDLQAASEAGERGLSLCAEGETAADLWALRARVASVKGAYSVSLSAAEEAISRARPGSVAYCLALEGALASAMLLGDIGAFGAHMSRLLTTEPDKDAISALARSFAPGVAALACSGWREAAAPFLMRLGELMAGRMEDEPGGAAALCYSSSIWAHFIEGDSYRALKLARDAERYLKLAGDEHIVTMVLAVLAMYYTELGALGEAEEVLASPLGDIHGDTMASAVARNSLAKLRVEQERYDEALSLTARDPEKLLDHGNAVAAATKTALISAHLGRGDLDAAEALLSGEGTSTSPAYEASALLLRARLALLRGHAGEAARLARESLLAFQAYALGGFEPARLLLAESLWAAGHRSDALREIKIAREEVLARAEKIADETYLKSFLENNRTNARILALAREWLKDP